MSRVTPEMVERVKKLLRNCLDAEADYYTDALSTLLSEWKERGERINELQGIVRMQSPALERLERSLAEARERIEPLAKSNLVLRVERDGLRESLREVVEALRWVVDAHESEESGADEDVDDAVAHAKELLAPEAFAAAKGEPQLCGDGTPVDPGAK